MLIKVLHFGAIPKIFNPTDCSHYVNFTYFAIQVSILSSSTFVQLHCFFFSLSLIHIYDGAFGIWKCITGDGIVSRKTRSLPDLNLMRSTLKEDESHRLHGAKQPHTQCQRNLVEGEEDIAETSSDGFPNSLLGCSPIKILFHLERQSI